MECNVKNCVRTAVDGELCREHVIDPAEFKTVPNREDLRRNKLTLRRRRAGYFRRQAIKRMRLGYEVLA